MTASCSLLGAEQQAALSFALAYPEQQFQFVTDAPAVDGWDIHNVELSFARPEGLLGGIALCPRWLPQSDRDSARLSSSLMQLVAGLAPHVLPVLPQPVPGSVWRLKGDAFHRPDAPVSGQASALLDITDSHGCGLVYQEEVVARGTVLVQGKRSGPTDVCLGALKIFAERFFRIDVIQAAQTVDRPDLVELSLAALNIINHTGWFTFVWLDTDQGPRLASFRPTPRAGQGALRAAGVDLLATPGGVTVASAGRRFVAYPHYASYRRLGA